VARPLLYVKVMTPLVHMPFSDGGLGDPVHQNKPLVSNPALRTAADLLCVPGNSIKDLPC